MLCVVVVSVSASFAADEDVALAEVDDEVVVDEDVLSVEQDDDALSVEDEPVVKSDDTSEVLSTSEHVNKDNFFTYFNETGALTSDADELIFEGDFSDLPVSQIMINTTNPVIFTSNNAVFKNVQFLILQSNVTINGFNLTYNDGDGKLFNIVSESVLDNITLSNNNIDFTAVEGRDSYAIFAGADISLDSNAVTNLSILNNIFRYVGNTNGSTINNVIRVKGYEGFVDEVTWDEIPPKASSNITVDGNTFYIQIPSVPRYNYMERPLDSYFSAGMEFYYCSDLEIKNNRIGVMYTTSNGAYDTIDIIDVRGNPYNMDFFGDIVCENINVTNNTIAALGHSYIYGISVSAKNSEISDNTLDIAADEYQAGGIYVEAPSQEATVINNNVSLNAAFVTYGIYSFENAYAGAVNGLMVTNNTVYGNAYASCGICLSGSDMFVSDNEITSRGNNTYGITLSGLRNGAYVDNNTVYCLGSCIGMIDTGDGYIPANSSKAVSISNNVVVANNRLYSTAIGISAIIEGTMVFYNNSIYIYAVNGKTDNHAIFADEIDDLTITDNVVYFYGTVEDQFVIIGYDDWGYPIYDSSNNTKCYGVYVRMSDDVEIRDNKFNLAIPTFPVNWAAGRQSYSEGIVIVGCDDMVFEDNNVSISVNGGSSDDTVYGIDVIDSLDAMINDNNITLIGVGYAYGIIINDNFTISGNDIIVTSDEYACGIDVEGTANGNITDNNICAAADYFAYPIYSGMNYMPVNIDIIDNDIFGEAYYVVGIEAGGVKANIEDNCITVTGNHTIGVGAYLDDELILSDNDIISEASNEGDIPVWDNFGTDTTGVKVAKGNFSITDNDIETTGDYAINSGDNSGNITNNDLLSNMGAGNEAIIGLGDVNATGNPETKNKYVKVVLVADNFSKVYGSSSQFVAKLLDENGKAVANQTVKLLIDGKTYAKTTDAEGKVAFDINLVPDEYFATVKFDGNGEYGYKSTTATITVTKKPTAITASGATLLVTSTKSGSNYNIVLKDDSGNVLSGKQVTVTFNGKTATYTTDANGVVAYKIVATKAGSYQMSISFNGDDKYLASTAASTIKVNKEATKLTAKKKTFKAKKKTKKYTVTLKDSKGKAIKKVRVTLKIKGKTYKAKTNAKGKATFKIKKLTKKGTYTAKVKYAGSTLYKAVTKSVKITIKK